MNALIVSDIHGAKDSLHHVLNTPYPYDFLILVGDLLYHGPRNPILEDYNPAEVATLLNAVSVPILAVRGNCDAEVDQLVLDFAMMQDYSISHFNQHRLCISHGHLFDPDEHAKISKCDLYITGHTHLLGLEQKEAYMMLNPGSISLPKGGHPASYAYLTENEVTLYQVADHSPLKTLELRP